ncbi:hypothetical protein [Spiroplasma endosymbiont of Clivina fossor]|uniref:hypothetical protein n=1 Tax=Spiroplasma endosymbiont of Clivina fossor TaxID=3066282 RepID=UPI00313D1147
MEQSFIKREKRATNPSQCDNGCKLEFASIQNSYIFKWPALGFVWNTDDKLDDLPQDVSALTIPERGSMSGYVFNFYKKIWLELLMLMVNMINIILIKLLM